MRSRWSRWEKVRWNNRSCKWIEFYLMSRSIDIISNIGDFVRMFFSTFRMIWWCSIGVYCTRSSVCRFVTIRENRDPGHNVNSTCKRADTHTLHGPRSFIGPLACTQSHIHEYLFRENDRAPLKKPTILMNAVAEWESVGVDFSIIIMVVVVVRVAAGRQAGELQ